VTTVNQMTGQVTGDHPLAGAALLIRWTADHLRGRPVISVHVEVEGQMVPVGIADLVRQQALTAKQPPFDQPPLFDTKDPQP
jgi:hypothetical protein